MKVTSPDKLTQKEQVKQIPQDIPREQRSGIRWPALLISLAIPIGVGVASALILGDSTALYDTLVLPPLSPPGWLFPIVWSVLYILMGVACYFVVVSHAGSSAKKRALITYGIQLAINALWSPLFFLWELFSVSSAVIILLMVAITATMEHFSRCSRTASRLLIPYLLWTAFAAYLNISIALLN